MTLETSLGTVPPMEHGLPPGLLQPLYLFSLDTLVTGGSSDRSPELERDESVVAAVADTLMALTFAGAETWVISDRPLTDAARTADWLSRHGVTPTTVYLGYTWGTDTGMDEDDMARLRAVFEVRGNEGRWPGLTVYSVGAGNDAPRIQLVSR